MTIAIAFCGVTEHQRQLEWASRFALAKNENLLILDVARSSTEDVVGTVKPDSEPRNADLGHATARLAETGLHWVTQFTDEPEQPSHEETNYKTDEKETDKKSNEDAAEMPVEDSTEVPIEDSPFKLQVELKEIRQPLPVKTILELLGQQDVSLLILPRQRKEKSTSPEFAIERQLFQQAPCMVVQLRVASSEKPTWHHSLLVAAGGGPHTGATLRLASRLATATDSRLTAMYVEPNVDDVAELVGQTPRPYCPEGFEDRCRSSTYQSGDVAQSYHRDRRRGKTRTRFVTPGSYASQRGPPVSLLFLFGTTSQFGRRSSSCGGSSTHSLDQPFAAWVGTECSIACAPARPDRTN